MKLPSLPLLLALLSGYVGTAPLVAAPAAGAASATHSVTADLIAQPDAAAALVWLQESFPPGSDLTLDLDFLAAATDTFDDPEDTSVRLYIYEAGGSTVDEHPRWIAWVGVDDEFIVLLLGSSPAGR